MDAWQRARFISYVSAVPYMTKKVSIWEFMPLPGDPTKEQLEEAERKENNRLQGEMDRILEEYKAMGFDFSDFKFSA